jgi:formylglycine-generating enzyme required for sulfatase activity
MNMKKLIVATVAFSGAASLFAAAVDAMTQDPNVLMTSLSVKQRYPWNGKVDIDFSFTSSIPEAFAFIQFKATYENKDGETVEVPMKTFDQVTIPWCTNAGTYRVTWDSTADSPNLLVTNLKYTVTANMAKYMVIDLSKGTAASAENKYPVFYYEDVPDFPGVEKGKWDDYHKTTNLVLRLIQPGTYKQAWSDDSSPTSCRRSAYQHNATITRPFYMAVFELTQQQCKFLQGHYGQTSRTFTGGNRLLRPASETYQNVRGRGYEGTINWPVTGSQVSDTSLLGKLRTRTGMNEFDIPTESEWEYVCRCGGTASGFWNDGSDAGISHKTKYSTVSDTTNVEALDGLGRYGFNGGYVVTFDEVGQTNIYTSTGGSYYSSDESVGTAAVGSYKPNAWGIYDMHGNLAEWCNGFIAGTYYGWSTGSDYYCNGQYPNMIDDLGPVTNPWGQWSSRSIRGGDYDRTARECIISARSSDNERLPHGVRLCWRFPTPPQVQE